MRSEEPESENSAVSSSIIGELSADVVPGE